MIPGGKAQRRAEILAARRALPEGLRDSESAQLCGHLAAAVAGAAVVCAYLPVRTEPGSEQLLTELRRLCRRVLLPVARSDPSGAPLPLRWADYEPGRLLPAPFGLREPAAPWLGPEAIAKASLVLVPALAVDRAGVRLGRGAGFYDRSLACCASGTRLVAVVRDCEVVDVLPAEPHDVRMTHALTPRGGLLTLTGMTGGR